MKTIKEKLPAERVTDFEKGAQVYAKKIVTDFKNYEFVGLSHLFPAGSKTSCSTLASPWIPMV